MAPISVQYRASPLSCVTKAQAPLRHKLPINLGGKLRSFSLGPGGPGGPGSPFNSFQLFAGPLFCFDPEGLLGRARDQGRGRALAKRPLPTCKVPGSKRQARYGTNISRGYDYDYDYDYGISRPASMGGATRPQSSLGGAARPRWGCHSASCHSASLGGATRPHLMGEGHSLAVPSFGRAGLINRTSNWPF